MENGEWRMENGKWGIMRRLTICRKLVSWM